MNGSAVPEGSTFQASESFPRNGDLLMIFLSGNGIRFQEPVDDLWYRATGPTVPIVIVTESGLTPGLPAYRPEEAASPMACLQQYQFCDASESRCGPLSSWVDAQIGASELFESTMDSTDSPSTESHRVSRFKWLTAMLTYAVPDVSYAVGQLGSSSLASTRSLYGNMMGPLPNDQWQVDVMQWWATYLAGIQGGVVSTAVGPMDSSQDHLRMKPYNQWIQDTLCNNQVSIILLGIGSEIGHGLTAPANC